MPIDDTAAFTINVIPYFFTGRALLAYTYHHQITSEKVDLLLAHHFNIIAIDGVLDNNVDYSGLPEHVSERALEYAAMAYQKNFSFFVDLHFTHPKFNPDTSIVLGGFPVVYSNGDEGRLMSPFCPAYWQWLTDLVKNLALLPVNYPDEYRLDGVLFDFELYNHDEGHSGYFSAEYGFEDWTFNQYCVSREITNPGLPADQRFNWLIEQGKIITDPGGNHTGDYYVFLSGLMKGYANNMREQVHAVNPHFFIGAYPSPIWRWYYLVEIQSGWSTQTEPSVIFGTEMYNSGGASKIPPGLNLHKLPGGYYDLTTIYQSHTSTNNPIYAYYLGGIIIMIDSSYYFSNDYAYHTYNIAKETNGYWVFTTYSLTEPYETLPDYYRIWCYDAETNSIIRPASAAQYSQEVQRYYNQMDIMYSELQQYLQDPTYVSPLTPTTPPPIVYEYPDIIPFPDVAPIQPPVLQLLTYSYQPRLRGQHHIILYAQAGQNAQFTIKYKDVIGYNGLQYIITDTNQTVITQGYMNYLNNQQTVSFIPTSTGCYLLSIHPTLNGCFHIIDTNIPMTIYNQSGEEAHAIQYVTGNKYNLFFWVDIETAVTLTVRGQNPQEGAAVSIYRPSPGGYVLFASGTTTPTQTSITFDLQIPLEAQQAIWKIEITKPENQILEDVWISSPQKNLFYFTDDPRYCLN